MTVIIERNGKKFSQTCVVLPMELKAEARMRGISMSGLLTAALISKLENTEDESA